MKLLRLATIYLSPPPKGWDAWQMTVNRCSVETINVRGSPPPDGQFRMFVKAQVKLDALPAIDSDRLITLPPSDIKECERAIEEAASTIAVMVRASRSISCPMPPVALLPESDIEREYLAGADGIRNPTRAFNRPWQQIPLSKAILEGLADRLDGVRLVADFLAQSHPLGSYREALRFLELAFALPVTKLERKLAQFLSRTNAGYTRAEVASWLSFRHPATHGDRTVMQPLALESDVRPLVARMEQAIYDVLLNKAQWRSPSQVRRALWTPDAVTTSPYGGLLIRQGSTPVLEAQLLDGFGAYPMDFSAALTPPPAEWWCPSEKAAP